MVNEDRVHLQNVVQNISTVFSLTINTFLIVLIATKSPKQLGAYKYLMMTISIHEIIYSISEVTVSPLLHSYGSTFMIIAITRDRIISPSLLLALVVVYCGLFGFSLAIFALHFVYRYLVASGNKRFLATFNSWKFFLWLGGPIIYGVSWALLAYYFEGPTDQTLRFVRNNVLETLDLEVDDFVYLGAYFYEKLEGDDYILHMSPFIGIIIMQVYIAVSLGIVLVFSVKCYSRINALVSKSTTSGKAQLLQSQLFYALVTQALIPIILMHCPVGFMFLFNSLGWNMGSLSEIVSITIALYPAIDPLPTIFMVKHYRKGVFEWWRWITRGNKPHSTHFSIYSMVNEDRVHLQNVVQNISTVFSLIFNTLLMVLIATKSPKQLGAYKYLMMCISIHEIIYSIIEVIVSPVFHSYGSTFLIIAITRDRIISPSLLLALIVVYCGLFGFSLAIFALHFVYRYLVASGNKRLLATFNSWKFFLWLGGPIIYAVSWALLAYYFEGPTDRTLRFVRNNVLDTLDLDADDFVFMGAYYYEKLKGGGYILHMSPFIGIVILEVYIAVSLGIVLVFSVKCYSRINALVSKSTTSGNAQLLQSQLFYALVTQALIPIILMHCPVGFMFLFNSLGWNMGSLSEIVSITIALYPAIDPLPTIFMVKHYRKGVFEWLRWITRGNKPRKRAVEVHGKTASTLI